MTASPVDLMLARLNAIAGEVAKVGPDNEETRKAVEASIARMEEAVSAGLAKQGEAFDGMRAHHAETLKAARAAPVWAVGKAAALATAAIAMLFALAVLGLQALGQAHVVIGPAAGFCATHPVEQANGGRACWVTPPEDAEAAGRLEVCVEPSYAVTMSDRSSPDQGRQHCWTGPRPVPEPQGEG